MSKLVQGIEELTHQMEILKLEMQIEQLKYELKKTKADNLVKSSKLMDTIDALTKRNNDIPPESYSYKDLKLHGVQIAKDCVKVAESFSYRWDDMGAIIAKELKKRHSLD